MNQKEREQVLKAIQERIAANKGNKSKTARQLGLSIPYFIDLSNGRRLPGERLLKKLGFKVEIVKR